nr:transmembrane protease serine 11B-like protein [Hydra vulgaris]
MPFFYSAILKLKTHIDLSYTSNEANICIPDKPASPDQTCNIVGWGFLKHNGVQPEVLQKAEVPIVSNNVCNEPEAYNKVIKEDYLLCAGYKNGKSDSCNYDSGGSLACLKDGMLMPISSENALRKIALIRACQQ